MTASDAEGLDFTASTQSEIESTESGIAFNYEGPDVLVNQAYGPSVWLRSPAWIGAFALPPLIYLALLGFISVKRWQGKDVAGRQARRAAGEFSKMLRKLSPADTDEYYAALLEALRQYLGSRLGLAAKAITFADVRPGLASRGADKEAVERLGTIFERCEAGRYAGAAYADLDAAHLSEAALEAVKAVERSLP